MYSYGYDLETACLVGIFSGMSSTDEDYRNLIRSSERLRIDSEERRMASTCVLVVDPGHHRPNDAQRRILAAGRDSYSGRFPIRIALVTESMLIRGVMKAMQWLSPPKPGHLSRAVRSFDHALLWCEEERGHILPALRRLLAEARAGARAAA